MNDDASVRRLKGPGHPTHQLAYRAAVLASFVSVRFVTAFGDDTLEGLLRRMRPDVFAKGGDDTLEMLAESSTVREYGGSLALLGYFAHG